ncbi:hypothetical protein EC9_14140 [Rosistilla ulvae]|uniref:Sulfotransferase domain protein n=1 Tax=Rosistilla ulvae TaxID=1930277 RepID=A0A517LX80_9BACT|nr:sulfotransferase [Rosistilla ulvae]QDS87236.1 hypothetical protein EC9_14140 [Rosistilla ulvae]
MTYQNLLRNKHLNNVMQIKAKYSAQSDDELFLQELNQLLKPAHDAHLIEPACEKHATIHVIGSPRSGTTLLTQLVASEFNVGFINNLSAAFWLAPAYGIRLARKLNRYQFESNLRSDFGQTNAIGEPHEFGRFWRELLGYSDMSEPCESHEKAIDWNRVKAVQASMLNANDGPMLFKSFLVAWHLKKFSEVMEKSLFVWIRRDLLENALSLLKTRRDYAASLDEWVGLRPKACSTNDFPTVHQQVAAQVYFVNSRIEQQLNDIDVSRWALVDYAMLCSDPNSELDRIFLKAQGLDATIKRRSLSILAQRESKPSNDADVGDIVKLQAAFDEIRDNQESVS